MEIITTLVGQGFTQDMYERLRQGVNWDGDPVDGWLAHAVYWDESGGIHRADGLRCSGNASVMSNVAASILRL